MDKGYNSEVSKLHDKTIKSDFKLETESSNFTMNVPLLVFIFLRGFGFSNSALPHVSSNTCLRVTIQSFHCKNVRDCTLAIVLHEDRVTCFYVSAISGAISMIIS